MAWIGGRKGRMGGNPSSVRRSSGDMPAAEESGGLGARRNLCTVLMGGAMSRQSQAPWQSAPSSYGTPKPSAFPKWITVDAHVCYASRSTGQMLEAIVEKVSHTKFEVKIVFAEDRSVWKVLPFSLIQGPQNPIVGLWTPVAGPMGKPEEGPVAGPAQEAQPSQPDKDSAEPPPPRSRSRSPRRAA
mmetsp:Transcript_71801/g.161109  ORF Transcript_71801/g.161109 Transcript_71801/m.161109 type:complete len:186 (+) Transcript_71801:92-649(+)